MCARRIADRVPVDLFAELLVIFVLDSFSRLHFILAHEVNQFGASRMRVIPKGYGVPKVIEGQCPLLGTHGSYLLRVQIANVDGFLIAYGSP